MRCYRGAGDDESLDRLVMLDELTPGDADAIRRFREFLLSVRPGARVTEVAALAREMVTGDER